MFSIKKYFIKKHFQKLLLQKAIERTVCQKEIKTVGIITTDAIFGGFNLLEEVEKTLNIKNAKMYSLRVNKKQPVLETHFSEKDFDWKGAIIQPKFKSFIDEPFDLLIGFFNTENLYLESAVLQSNAAFKVGFSDVNQQLYDIEIAETENRTATFLEELKKYLLLLKKLKN